MNEHHPGGLGLVGNKPAELGERPRVQRGPLGLTEPYPLADPRQLFDGDATLGALRNAAASESVGSTRTLITCLTLPTLAASTDTNWMFTGGVETLGNNSWSRRERLAWR